jgi:AhpD family alkylhydroperoxidase
MARVTMIPGEQWPAELRELTGADRLSPLEQGNLRVYANRPELAIAYARFMAALRAPGELSPRLRELVRIRVAFHNQCRSCMAVRYDDAAQDGVDEDLVCQLAAPEEAEDLTDAERAALDFADRLATDHLSITDATLDDLRRHFSEPAIVELGLHVASYVGFGRLSSAWDMVDELPDRFHARDDGPVTPWGDGIIRVGVRSDDSASA